MRILNFGIMLAVAFAVFTFKLRGKYPAKNPARQEISSNYQTNTTSQTYYPEASNPIAMNGYDVVSMVKENIAKKGAFEHQFTWKDEVWLFESKENRRTFTYNPTLYAPQFEGLSVFWVARNQLIAGSEKFWSIHDGKLYVNDNEGSHQSWLDNKDTTLLWAEKNWVTIDKSF